MDQPSQLRNIFQPQGQSVPKETISMSHIDQTVVQMQQSQLVPPSPLPQILVKYAGFWVRFVASLVDGIIISLVGTGIVVVFVYVLKVSRDNMIFGFLNLILTWIYAVSMLGGKHQATIGKRMMGLMVTSDALEKPTLVKIIVRETIGKILSAIPLGIGYIMAGFTQKKQALHDKVAGTVVIHRNPNDKTNTAMIIGIIIMSIIVLFIIGGFLSKFSLNSAQNKAYDAIITSALLNDIPKALLYQDEHQTFKGFQPITDKSTYPECSGDPIVNISPDGLRMAIFGKLCFNKNQYFCVDIVSNGKVVDETYAKSGAMSCQLGNDLSQDKMQQSKVPSEVLSNVNSPQHIQDLDVSVYGNVGMAAVDIEEYKRTQGLYKGYVLNVSNETQRFRTSVSDPQCDSEMHVDISPDGGSYIAYEPLCTDTQRSYCVENGIIEPVVVLTDTAKTTYKCQ